MPRPRFLLPRPRGDARASIVAALLQGAFLFIVVPATLVPVAAGFLRDDQGNAVRPEGISFIAMAPRTTATPGRAPRAGGDGREQGEVVNAEPPAPIVAPAEVPTAIFPAPAGTRDPGGTGPVIGGGGPLRGIQPAFTDPRLWLPPSDEVIGPDAPKTRADSLRMLLAERAVAFLDSMAALPVERRPGDWTFERGGKKYGVDQQFIRLGKFSIPTALLAALPLNAQGNPIQAERALRLDQMRREIQFQAARQARDDDFRAAVRALRERKERERRDAEAAAQKAPIVLP